MPHGLPFIQARVTESRRAAIESAAAKEGVNRGELVRRAIDAYLETHGYPLDLTAQLDGQTELEMTG